MLRLSTYGMVALVIAIASLRRRHAWRFVEIIAYAGSAYALFGILAALTGINPILETPGPAVSASFANRNAFAIYAALGLLANVTILQHRLSTDGPILHMIERFFVEGWRFAFGALLCAAAIAMTTSRGGAGAALIGLFALLTMLDPERRRILWLLVALIVGFVLMTLTDGTIERILTARTSHHRWLVYTALWEQTGTRLWLGHGLGAFHDTFRPHLPLDVAHAEWRRAHSSYLENLYELGLLGAVPLYAALTLVTLRLVQGLRRRKHDRALPAFGLATIVTCGLHAGVDFSLQMPALAALFAAILGLSWAQSFSRQDRHMS